MPRDQPPDSQSGADDRERARYQNGIEKSHLLNGFTRLLARIRFYRTEGEKR
jgi:hypothetical protein